MSSTATLQQPLALAHSITHRSSLLAPALLVSALTFALIEHVVSRVSAAANKYLDIYLNDWSGSLGSLCSLFSGGGGGGGGGVSTLPSSPPYLLWSAQQSVALSGVTAALGNLDATTAPSDTILLRPCSAASSPLLCLVLRGSVGCYSGSW